MHHDERDRSELVERLAARTVGLVEREYPNGMRLVLSGPPAEPPTPRSTYPAFYGCFDWHSSVHSHWQLVRAMRTLPDADFVGPATAALDRTLTPANVAGEMQVVAAWPGFEMPYGMAWLLRLVAELREWRDDRGRRWADALEPLEAHATGRFEHYCSVLTRPQRGGMHDQTAFSLALVWDASPGLRSTIADAAGRLFGDDVDADLRFEPSAADFLSASLGEADLMRRVLRPDDFVRWLDGFAPEGFGVLQPVEMVDASDGRLAHWAGLNLSRSWMMRSIAAALPADHRSVDDLVAGAAAHAEAGLATADHDDYMVSHWVPTFAVYLLT